jgi:hypothetical protein
LGDIVFSTDNNVILRCIYPGRLPITYDKESAPAQRMTTTNMIKADLNTFDCKIGQTTNYSTKFFSMLCNYDRESREYKELTERIKLLRRYISDSIDAGKGIKTKPFPAEWKSWKRVPEDWTEEQKSEQWFLNNLVEKRKPYFFVYIYDAVMEDYKREKKRLDKECRNIFGINFNELKSKEDKTQEEKNFVKKYYNEMPVTKTPCIINKMAWRIEGMEFDFKHPKNTPEENLAMAEKMISGSTKFTKAKMDFVRAQYKHWKSLIKQKFQRNINEDYSATNADDFGSFNEQLEDSITERISRELEEMIPNSVELADYLVQLAYIDQKPEAKAFCWAFGSEGIIKNLLLKNYGKPLLVPVEDNDGELYLDRRYKLGEIWYDYF